MDWLQQLLAGLGAGGGGAASASVIDPLDVPLDQMAQAKLSAGSPYEQDRLAQALHQQPAGDPSKWRKWAQGAGERAIMNGLAGSGQPQRGQMGPPQAALGPRPQIRPPAQLILPPGQNPFRVNSEEERRKMQQSPGRFMFTPNMF